jgi:hypothetical protein
VNFSRTNGREHGLRTKSAVFTLLFILFGNVLAQSPIASFDQMSDDELRAFREQKVSELKERVRTIQPRQTIDGMVYDGIFFCTIYYTPKESGFTADRGFDTTPTIAPGLHGHTYPRDFLLAVKKEGFGRISQPVGECNYVRWMGDGDFAFAKTPVGHRGEVLVPRRSCAISKHNKFFRQHSRLVIKSQTIESEIGNNEWIVCDTGPAVHPLQIDLYWGEDEPRGAIGRQRARPNGTPLEYAFETEVTVKE